MVNELNRLLIGAPRGGYGEHSVEMKKITQLRRGISALMEIGDRSAGANPASLAPHEYPPTSGPEDRMLQIQTLLSQIDDLVSTGGSSEETHNRIKELRAQITLLTDSSSDAASRSATLSFPEAAHLDSSGRTVNFHQDSGRRSDEGRAQGPQDEPPPYQTVVGTSEEGRTVP